MQFSAGVAFTVSNSRLLSSFTHCRPALLQESFQPLPFTVELGLSWNVGIQRIITLNTLVIHKKGSPYSITERRVPEVFGSQPAGDVSHKPSGRLPLLSARPAVTPATIKRAATNFALGEQRHNECEQFA